jgi:outer membrane protein OmpA-like peptidoglycan-associated protein
VLLLVTMAGCDGDGAEPSTSGAAPHASVSPAGGATPGSATRPARSAACDPGPGRSVTDLPDIHVAAVHVPAVVADDGSTVVHAFVVPAQTVDAGCVVRYDAPGGCLGAVRVTPVVIPAATIPSSRLPAAAVGGQQVPAQEFPAVVAPEVRRPGAYAPQVCRPTRHGRLVTVTRQGVVRPGFSRNGVARPGGSRPGRCDAGECVPAVRVATVRLPPVEVPDVDIAPAHLRTTKLRQDRRLSVVGGGHRLSYVAPASVLFDTDRFEIRPDADAALLAIARQLRRAAAPDDRILVEGHTDDRGTAQHGLVLSRQRARAVAGWLARHGFDRTRITTVGYGERDPVVPNTSAVNRQRNRRVVITLVR